MRRHSLILIIAFVMLWTGTLMHDCVGVELTKFLHNNFGSIVIEDDVYDYKDQSGTEMGHHQCPCAMHWHSPWAVARSTVSVNATAFKLKQPIASVILLSDARINLTPRLKLVEPSGERGSQPDLYLMHRVFLI